MGLLKIIAAILRIICSPLHVLVSILYKYNVSPSPVVCYSWYINSRDYEEIIGSRKNIIDSNIITMTYAQWRESAGEAIEHFEEIEVLYVKIAVTPKLYFKWLKRHAKPNTTDSVEEYILFVYEQGKIHGMESKV